MTDDERVQQIKATHDKDVADATERAKIENCQRVPLSSDQFYHRCELLALIPDLIREARVEAYVDCLQVANGDWGRWGRAGTGLVAKCIQELIDGVSNGNSPPRNSQPQWHKWPEEKPGKPGWYLVADGTLEEGAIITIESFDEEPAEEWSNYGGITVEHWMELPPPPKETTIC